MVTRFVGAPWLLEVLDEPQSTPLVLSGGLDTLEPARVEPAAQGVDKVWLILLREPATGLEFIGREYDVATRRLGAVQRRAAVVARDAPRTMLLFSLDLFSPYATIGERFGKDVTLRVQAAALEPASPIGRVAAPGTFFLPYRVVPRKGAQPLVVEIPYTFLRVDKSEAGGVRCSFASGLPDPFTSRVVQKTELVALGVKPGDSPTKLRFVTLPDKTPAAGYVLTARPFPEGSSREVGLTDREGRITLPPRFSDGLVVLRLLAGSEEPMIEFPLMPGRLDTELAVPPFDPKPQTVALETRLDSLRDSVVDLVAVRARLEARLKARFDGEDWPGAEEALKEFHKLTPRETFETEVTRLKEEAARQQAATKRAVLTRTAQARIADLQALIERYLDDEGFKAYADALEKLKTEPPAARKAPAAAPALVKPAAPVVAAPVEKPAPPPVPPPAEPKPAPAKPTVPF
ncbi:MAG: hypothetical protein U0835_07160 [Isosphaeraceae bacterium]